jgi:hypothetical protein
VLSGIPLAPATSVGLGGAGGAFPPVLTMTPPILGGSVSAGLVGAAPSATAVLAIDLAVGVPTNIGGGCVAHLDAAHVASWLILPLSVGSTGSANLSIPVPSIPVLVGYPATAQAVVYDAAAPFGFDLSNGIAMTLGY